MARLTTLGSRWIAIVLLGSLATMYKMRACMAARL